MCCYKRLVLVYRVLVHKGTYLEAKNDIFFYMCTQYEQSPFSKRLKSRTRNSVRFSACKLNIVPDLISLIIFGEEHKAPHCAIFSSLLLLLLTYVHMLFSSPCAHIEFPSGTRHVCISLM
jgi:hypothetical protein